MSGRRSVLVVLAGVLATPAPALACSSCSYGAGNGLMVYLGTAALMGALPLVMVAALALWLRRRLRARRIEDEERGTFETEPLRSASPSTRH